ncbi:MAG TPA: GAF domain-containing protein [Albitalea sp.]|uniref:GAF domain-containing protein n=1 Tax=Piscinibacter sp. TaxID=1903157 RepID=UPI002ED5EF4B
MATRFGQRMRLIGAQFADGRIDHATARRELLAAIRGQFACSRASYWSLAGEPGNRVIECVASQAAPGVAEHVPGLTLRENDFPGYFGDLVQRRIVVCDDTLIDPRFASMRAHYDRPDGTRALLDAPFAANGRTFGVLCCEQVGAPRHWTPHDMMVLMRCATTISMYIARMGQSLPASRVAPGLRVS